MAAKIFIVSKVGKTCRECGSKLIKTPDRTPVCKKCGLTHMTPVGYYTATHIHGQKITKEDIVNMDKFPMVEEYIAIEEARKERILKAMEEFKAGVEV